MNVLALDTCFGAVSVAVRWADRQGIQKLHDAYELRERGHAERLMPMIAELMERAGLAYGELDCIAVTQGPGSFTGVRTGVAAARGLALAMGRPIVAASSLAVMAEQARDVLADRCHGKRLIVAMDARRDMAFIETFGDGPDDIGRPTGSLLLSIGEAAAHVALRPALVVGSAAQAIASAVRADGAVVEVALEDLQPHARILAQMADRLAPTNPLRPLYLRPPDVKSQDDKSLPHAQPRWTP